MELILKEDVVNLGYKDDIVKVKAGYGRNYLIPNGVAIMATESAKKVLAEDLRQRAHKLEKMKADAQEMVSKFEGVHLSVGAKVSSTGKIFGSVGPIQLAEALEKQGLTIDRKSILLKEPVKEIGEFTATIRLHREVQVEISFDVVAE